jgi:protein SCO1/2
MTETTAAFLLAGGLTAFLAACYGRIKADALRGSHAWFGCTASPVVLALALRQALALHAWALLPLLGLSLLFQRLGRRAPEKTAPTALRWRTAVYAGLTGAALLLAHGPAMAADPYAQHDSHAQHGMDKLKGAADPHAQHRAEALKGEHKRLEIDEPAPGFSLTNQHGKRVALKDLRGKVVAMTFFYTHCTDVCPILTNSLDSAARQLSPEERKHVMLVGVTVDPKRDTPARLKTYIKDHGLEAGQWQMMSGSIARATQAAADYGIVVRPAPGGDFVHNSVYILIDRQGIERVEHHGVATPNEALLADLRALLAAPAKK